MSGIHTDCEYYMKLFESCAKIDKNQSILVHQTEENGNKLAAKIMRKQKRKKNQMLHYL